MIRGLDGEKLTPKKKAEEIINVFLHGLTYLDDDSDDFEGMTDAEKAKVMDQMQKIHRRIDKLLGYNPR
mgnify:CR=1 FL=1